MKSIVDILSIIVGIAAIGYAIYQFYLFVVSPGREGNTTHLWWSIGAAVVGCVCLVAFFLRHVNKEEEIHITQ